MTAHTTTAGERIRPVILCGGSGTRLWPLSRPERPKPFLPLLGGETLFQATVRRCSDPARFASPTVVAGARHVPLIREQAPEPENTAILVEPAARNTAPAIALAAARLPPDALMLVCPSDHHIADEAAFLEGVDRAAALAREGWLTAFGIAPDRAETGYGYIRRGEALGPGHRIARFVEKPDRATAEGYLASGEYSWNGGIFLFRAGTLLEELTRQRPAMAQRVREAVAGGREEGPLFHPEPQAFGATEGESIDYAVMEGTGHAAMVAVAMGWSDIGTWQALQAARGGDGSGNHARGAVELTDCRNIMVQSDGPRVSAIGLENTIIVVDGGEVLVVSADAAARVGTLGGAREA